MAHIICINRELKVFVSHLESIIYSSEILLLQQVILFECLFFDENVSSIEYRIEQIKDHELAMMHLVGIYLIFMGHHGIERFEHFFTAICLLKYFRLSFPSPHDIYGSLSVINDLETEFKSIFQ